MIGDNLRHLFPPTEPDRSDDEVLVAVLALDEVADTAESVIGGVIELKRHARSEYSGVRAAAETAMATARDALHPAETGDQSWVDNGLFRRGRRLDDALLKARRRLARRAGASAAFQRPWIVLSITLTVVAAWLISQHYWAIAAALVVGRVLISARFGEEHNLPFEGRTSGTRASTIVYRCLADYVGDALLLLAIVWVLMDASRSMWAMAAAAAVVVMLIATLLRIASLEVGVQIYRLTMERFVRTGSLLIALVALAVVQPNIAQRGALWLGVAIAGPLLYGFGEMARAATRLHAADIAFGFSLPQVHITVCDHEGSRRLPSDVDRLRRRLAPAAEMGRTGTGDARRVG